MPSARALARTAALLATCASMSGCVWFSGYSQVQVTSDPMGAEVFVDGEPSGNFTPTILELDGFGGSDKEIELRLPGHEPERRTLTQRSTTEVRRFTDGTDFRVYSTPLWWNLGDALFPFDFKYTYVPRDLHVVLYPIGEAPVGSGFDDSVEADFEEALQGKPGQPTGTGASSPAETPATTGIRE